MGLRGYIFRRIIYSIVILYIIATLNFVIFRLMPIDPVRAIVGQNVFYASRPDIVEQLTAMFGLDKPLPVQYLYYVWDMFTFNFGYSFQSGFPFVTAGIAQRLPNTLLLLGSSTILAVIIGIALGTIAAARRGSMADNTIVTSGLLTNALPSFWLGLIILTVFGLGLQWIPLAGTMSRPPPTDPIAQIVDVLWHLAAPMTVLTIISFGGFILIMRATLLEVMSEDYIVTARAKGLDEHTVLFRHAMRNALLPMVTVIALSFGFILSGAIITETIFSWQGLGYWAYASISTRDYPVLQALFFIISLCVVLANFIADIIYGFLDPRIKR